MNTVPRGAPGSALVLRPVRCCAALVLLLTFHVPARAGYLHLANCALSSDGVLEVQAPSVCASAASAPESSTVTDVSTLPGSPLIPVGPLASGSSRCGVGASNTTNGQRRWRPSAGAVLAESRPVDPHLICLPWPRLAVTGFFLARDSVFRPPRMPG